MLKCQVVVIVTKEYMRTWMNNPMLDRAFSDMPKRGMSICGKPLQVESFSVFSDFNETFRDRLFRIAEKLSFDYDPSDNKHDEDHYVGYSVEVCDEVFSCKVIIARDQSNNLVVHYPNYNPSDKNQIKLMREVNQRCRGFSLNPTVSIDFSDTSSQVVEHSTSDHLEL